VGDPARSAGRAAHALRAVTAAALAVMIILLVALWGRTVALAAERGEADAMRLPRPAAVPDQPAPGGSDLTGLDPAGADGTGAVTPPAAGGPGRLAALVAAAEQAARLLAESPAAATTAWAPVPPSLAGWPHVGADAADSPGERGPKGSAQVVPELRAVRPRYPRIEVAAAAGEGDGRRRDGDDQAAGTRASEPATPEPADRVGRLPDPADAAPTAAEWNTWLLLGVIAALAEQEPLAPGRAVPPSPLAWALLAQAATNPTGAVPGLGPSPDATRGGDRARTRPEGQRLYVPPLTTPFLPKHFGDDDTDPDNWHQFSEQVWRGEAPLFTPQSLLFTVLSTATGFYGNRLREGLPYAFGNLPTFFARDIFGQIMVGRPIREDPYDNLVWAIALNSLNVAIWELVGYGGTRLLAPETFDPIVRRWLTWTVSPPPTRFGQWLLHTLDTGLGRGGYLDRVLGRWQASANSPQVRRGLQTIASMLGTREGIDRFLRMMRVRLAGPPTRAVSASLDVLEFLKGKQLHSGIPVQIIGINIGAQLMINVLKPELPLPLPAAIDDNGQPLFASNLGYLANKLYDSVLGIGLPTFIGSIFAATKIVGLAAKSRVAWKIALMNAAFKLGSDLVTDRHSLDEFDRLRYQPDHDVYELLLSDVLNNATWVAYTPWWLVRYAIPSAVSRAASKEASDEDPRINRDQADKAWRNLVQLPTPEGVAENLIHLAANGADIAGHAALLAGQYVAKVVDFNKHDEPADFQILDLKGRIGADKDRVFDDSAALWRKLKLAVTGTQEAEGGTTERAAAATGPAATAHSPTEQPPTSGLAGSAPSPTEPSRRPSLRPTVSAEVETADGPVHVLEDGRITNVDEETGLLEPSDNGGRQAGMEDPAPGGAPHGEKVTDGKRSLDIVGVETTINGKRVLWRFDGEIVPIPEDPEPLDDKGPPSGGNGTLTVMPEQDRSGPLPAAPEEPGTAEQTRIPPPPSPRPDTPSRLAGQVGEEPPVSPSPPPADRPAEEQGSAGSAEDRAADRPADDQSAGRHLQERAEQHHEPVAGRTPAGQATAEPQTSARVAPPPPNGADPTPGTGGASGADVGSSGGEAPNGDGVAPDHSDHLPGEHTDASVDALAAGSLA
jgi:hypothetical protein